MNNGVLIKELTTKLNTKLDEFFIEIKPKIIDILKNKIFREMKDKYYYDLNDKVCTLQNEVSKLNKSIKNMEQFLQDSVCNPVSIQTLISDIDTYNSNKDTILSQELDYDCIRNSIKDDSLFTLKIKFNANESLLSSRNVLDRNFSIP